MPEDALLIEHQDNGKKGRFFVEVQGKILAEMTYVWIGEDRFIIDHTEVSDVLKGKGIGQKMVQAAVDLARERRIKILPLYPFAKAVFLKTKSFEDVLN